MALFQPSNITPSDLSGIGTIDATEDMAVTWQVNGTGNTPMTAYKVDLMKNDTASTLLYTTGQIALSEPFYGADNLGNPEYFTATIAKEALAAAGITNNADEGYKLLITQWWSAADSVAQTSASAFICRSRPQISIENFEQTITTMSYTFDGLYTQAQGDPIEWARWQISTGAGDVTLLDTGRIYNMGKMEISYDGFISGNNYSVRLSGQTINGVEFDTGWHAFSVQYQQTTFDGAAVACANCDTDAVQVNFPTPLYTMGRGGGNWAIIGGVGGNDLSLPAQTDSVAWDSGDGSTLVINYPFSLAWHGYITNLSAEANPMSVLMGNGMLNMTVSSTGMTVTAGDRTLISLSRAFAISDEIIMGVTPGGYFAKINPGTQSAEEYAGTLTAWQDEINAITLYGPQTCEYVWVVRGEFTEAQMQNVTLDTPSFDTTTQFLASFDTGLSAGAIRTADPVTQVLVYRQTTGESTVHRAATLNIGVTAFRDYSAVNGKTYKYYLYGATENGMGTTVIASNAIMTNYWNYDLLLCSVDSSGTYHVQSEYRFALDVSSGTMSNNSKATMQANFTRYPLRQPNTQNYRSSTLTAYVGKSVNGNYVDSLSEIDALREISTSTLTKFLKTRKGELIQVETEDPINMSIGDKYAAQPVRAAIKWVEVGSTENVSVITTTGDTYWTLS